MDELLDTLVRTYEHGKCTRRELLAALIAVTASSAYGQGSGAIATAPLKTSELNHVTLRVKDLSRSKDFYGRLLGLSLLKEEKDVCRLGLGRGFLALWQDPTPGFDHWCVGVEPFEREPLRRRLERDAVPLRRDADDPDTIYVRDPDGLVLQLEAPGFQA